MSTVLDHIFMIFISMAFLFSLTLAVITKLAHHIGCTGTQHQYCGRQLTKTAWFWIASFHSKLHVFTFHLHLIKNSLAYQWPSIKCCSNT